MYYTVLTFLNVELEGQVRLWENANGISLADLFMGKG